MIIRNITPTNDGAIYRRSLSPLRWFGMTPRVMGLGGGVGRCRDAMHCVSTVRTSPLGASL